MLDIAVKNLTEEGRLFDVPQVARQTFSRHFLQSVHCQLTFAEVDIEQILSSSDAISKMLHLANEDVVERIDEGSIEMRSGGEEHSLKHSSKPVGLLFKRQKPRMDVTLRSGSLVLSSYEYTGFDDFLKLQSEMLQLLEKVVGRAEFTSIGLRKINSMIIAPVKSLRETLKLFNPALFSLPRSGLTSDDAIKMFEGSVYLEKNGIASVVRHRLRQLNKPVDFEANLDFDLIYQGLTTSEEVLHKHLPEMNETIFDLFSWSVSEDMKNIMSHGD